MRVALLEALGGGSCGTHARDGMVQGGPGTSGIQRRVLRGKSKIPPWRFYDFILRRVVRMELWGAVD